MTNLLEFLLQKLYHTATLQTYPVQCKCNKSPCFQSSNTAHIIKCYIKTTFLYFISLPPDSDVAASFAKCSAKLCVQSKIAHIGSSAHADMLQLYKLKVRSYSA